MESLPSPTVFVVDDDPSVCKALSRLLRTAGWNVRSFQSAEQFLAYEREGGIGCLVLDIRMPDMDGLALQRRLLEEAPGLPIVFITGQEEDETIMPELAHGTIAVIPKPLDEKTLLAAIVKSFARQSGPGREEPAPQGRKP